MPKNLALLIVVGLLMVSLYAVLNATPGKEQLPEVSYSSFKRDLSKNKIDQVEIKDKIITVHSTDPKLWYKVNTTGNPVLADELVGKGIAVKVVLPEKSSGIWSILLSWFPILLLIGVWVFFMKNMQGGRGGLGGFGKSRAKLLTQQKGRVTFADVAGCDEAKQEVEEIVDYLRDPYKFGELGGKMPKGCLLIGPPGTGKTLMARAIAGQANVPFYTISGSDFVEMFVGVGASRVRDMFEQGKKNAPCIVFIDEIDAVGRHRGAGFGGGNDEREQTLNQLLVEMDGFESTDGVIIIAATNRPDVLDPALLRPGRFDRQVTIPNPDLLGREQILKVYLPKIKLIPTWSDHETRIIARKTPGMSGADLTNLVNEASLLAGRAGRKFITMEDFEAATDKLLMGPERRQNALTDEDKKLIAFHEAGHAIVGLNCKYHDPLHKVTIIPRGRAMGITMNLPDKDRFGYTKQELLDRLASMYGGREAEAAIFGDDHVTTGAGNDIQQATNIARSMVKEYGMGSEITGRVRYASDQQEVFLGHSVSQTTNISQKYAELVDDEVKAITSAAEKRARQILENKREDLHKIAEALLIYETLTGDEVKDLIAGKDISKPDIMPDDEANEIREEVRKEVKRSSVPISPLKKPQED